MGLFNLSSLFLNGPFIYFISVSLWQHDLLKIKLLHCEARKSKNQSPYSTEMILSDFYQFALIPPSP